MGLVALDLPAGIYRNGTDLQAQGRWRDANLVRWHDNTMQPIKGWRTRSDTAAASKIRSINAWIDNSNDRWISAGSYNKLYVYNAAGSQFDITPSGLASGFEDANNPVGYGNSYYGQEAYGTQRQESDIPDPATTWSLQSWGEYLIACSDADGKIYEWQLNTSNISAQITNAPVNNRGIVVTDERFLLALGAGGNPRKVQWCDRENNTLWTVAATNEAGDYELQTNGRIECGVRVQNQTLILTDTDAHTATYSGPPYVYGFERVGTSCGVISKQAVATVDLGAVWMGPRSFYVYSGGAVQEIESDVADYVFSDLNSSQASKVIAVSNAKFSEIRWFYPSGGSTENDRYVAFNYADQTWSIGTLARTAAIDAGVYRYPLYADPITKKIYEHEVGNNYDGATPFAETGPVSMGTGDNIFSITNMIPDERTQGDVEATFKARMYPNDQERSYGPYSMSNPTSLRVTGRQIRLRVEGANLSDWRVGINRIEVKSRGKR